MLYWAVIGSGDVVNRLVKNSFHIPGKSSVKYIYSKKYDEAKKISLKYKLGKIADDTKKRFDRGHEHGDDGMMDMGY